MGKLAVTGVVVTVLVLWLLNSGTASLGGEPNKQDPQQKSNVEELLGLEKRRQQLMEKEAALAAKEQELNRLSASLDARLKELNSAQKAFEDALNEKKKKEAELATGKYMKMFKLLKAMRPEEAAKIMDKLEEPVAIGLLEKYDQRTVLKLAKYISQQRLLRWIKEDLQAGRPR